jgi:hypothetical protein
MTVIILHRIDCAVRAEIHGQAVRPGGRQGGGLALIAETLLADT